MPLCGTDRAEVLLSPGVRSHPMETYHATLKDPRGLDPALGLGPSDGDTMQETNRCKHTRQVYFHTGPWTSSFFPNKGARLGRKVRHFYRVLKAGSRLQKQMHSYRVFIGTVKLSKAYLKKIVIALNILLPTLSEK